MTDCDGASGTPRPHTVHGIVQDSEGVPLPGVTITFTSPALRETVILVSDGHGEYRSGAFAPGEYQVEFSLPAFRTERQVFRLQPGDSLLLNMTMNVDGSFAEEIVVKAEVPVVDTTSTAVAASYLVNGVRTTDLAPASSAAIAVLPWDPDMPYLETLGR